MHAPTFGDFEQSLTVVLSIPCGPTLHVDSFERDQYLDTLLSVAVVSDAPLYDEPARKNVWLPLDIHSAWSNKFYFPFGDIFQKYV
jgi:hypothetical protein